MSDPSKRILLALSLLLPVRPAYLFGCSTIPNFNTSQSGNNLTLTWSAPAGAPAGTMYQVVQTAYGDWCQAYAKTNGTATVLTTTSATSVTVPLSLASNQVYSFNVREQIDPCTTTSTTSWDTFTSPATAPPIPTVNVSGSTVTLTFPYSDPHAMMVVAVRDGVWGRSASVFCNPAPLSIVESNVPVGSHQYHLDARTSLYDANSATFTVTVSAVPPPTIVSFTATPTTIQPGQSATLSWSTQNATSVSIDQGIGAQPSTGSITVSPAATTAYTLTATNASGTTTARATINVAAPIPLPSITSFIATPSTIEAGQSTTLSWITQNATSVTIDHNIGTQLAWGSVGVSPLTTTTYMLTAANAAGSVNATATVTVLSAQLPGIISFTATPPTIRAGQPSTLSWTTQKATSVMIDQGIGSQHSSGTATVTPASTTTYTLTAMSGAQTATAQATVTVITAPSIVVSSFPSPMLQQQGAAGGTTSYALMNAGGAPSTITLSQSGTFFSQSPSTFTLAPGATQVVSVTGSPQPAGEFEGASLPAGSGVPAGLSIPIKLLSSAPPDGVVTAHPIGGRIDVAAPAGTSPSGSASFTNTGTATLTGVLSADVPWIVPQSGVVTIAPGATIPMSFRIDRTKRSDAAAPAGSLSGNLSLSYLSGSAAKVGGLEAATPSVSFVTIVDTVQLTVSSAAPPPLAPGEIALFVPGAGHVIGSVGTFISDVSILNPNRSAPINDIRLYFTPTAAGSPQKLAQLPPVGAVSVGIADVVKNVFGSDAQVGSLQIRSALAAKLLVSTNIFNASNPAGTYGTAIPTFRSDSAASPGGKVFLTGLRKDGTTHTNLFIQETAGVGATVQTEFIAADGSSLGSRSDSVGAFALLQINDVVPANAVSAILTNTSSSAGKFVAYATPVDEASGDNWSVVDWPGYYAYSPSTSAVIIPVAGMVHGANNTFFQTDVALVNSGSTQASGTMRYVPRSGEVVYRQITLGPRQSDSVNNVVGTLFGMNTDSLGYLVYAPSTGNVTITSRTYTTIAGKPGTFGTGVPALAFTQAMKAGTLHSISALADSCLATVTAGRPATFRTNFALLEVAGQPAVVRVTLRFNYPAGQMVQGLGSASKDYTLAPGQFLMMNGIANEIIGSGRSVMGDLRDLEASFQVLSGDGSVLVFTSSVDNGTGDSILRAE